MNARPEFCVVVQLKVRNACLRMLVRLCLIAIVIQIVVIKNDIDQCIIITITYDTPNLLRYLTLVTTNLLRYLTLVTALGMYNKRHSVNHQYNTYTQSIYTQYIHPVNLKYSDTHTHNDTHTSVYMYEERMHVHT